MKSTESYELVHDYYRIHNRQLATSLKESMHEAAKVIFNTAEELE